MRGERIKTDAEVSKCPLAWVAAILGNIHNI